jgi:hypothetical protein
MIRQIGRDCPFCRVSNGTQEKQMDIIYLNDLKIETVIGIYDWEREIKQTVILDG